VPSLVDPTVRVRASLLVAVAEFRADRDFPVPWYVTDVPPAALTDEPGFAAYVRRLLAEPQEESPRPAGFTAPLPRVHVRLRSSAPAGVDRLVVPACGVDRPS
jgi:hypothetical protein